MADEVYISEIRTNTDSLSERAVHEALVNIVSHVVFEGGDALKAIVPHDTGALAAHAGHTEVHDESGVASASVGVPDIFEPGKDPVSMKYPIFVDEGTGIYGEYKTPIFAKRSSYMKLPPKEGYSIYQHTVKGQKPQHFMAKTYALMMASTDINILRFKQELKARLAAGELT